MKVSFLKAFLFDVAGVFHQHAAGCFVVNRRELGTHIYNGVRLARKQESSGSWPRAKQPAPLPLFQGMQRPNHSSLQHQHGCFPGSSGPGVKVTFVDSGKQRHLEKGA